MAVTGLKQAVFLGLVLCVFYGTVDSVCPANRLQAQYLINLCTSPLTTLNEYYSDDLLRLCNESGNQMMSCLQGMLDDCETANKSNAVRAINEIIDVDNFLTSVSFLCNNTSVIRENSECIDLMQNASNACVRTEFSIYNSSLVTIRDQLFERGYRWYKAELKNSACNYSRELDGCARLYDTNCSSEVYRVISSLFTAARIPECDGNATENVNQCPLPGRDTILSLQRCTLSVASLTNFANGFPAPNRVQGFCQNAADYTVSCLQNLTQCGTASPEIKSTLDNSLNIGLIIRFTELACNNAQLLTAEQNCLGEIATDVDDCTEAEYLAYRRRLEEEDKKASEMGQNISREQIVRTTCIYGSNLGRCADIIGTCGSTLGQIYQTLIDAARSPACANIELTTTTSTEALLPEFGGL